jgi:hypothetical protein
LLEGRYQAIKEFPFRPLPEYEVWTADVAIVDRALWLASANEDYFRGTPLIVIEVLSPLNTASEMLAREEICRGNGAQEFCPVFRCLQPDTPRGCSGVSLDASRIFPLGSER